MNLVTPVFHSTLHQRIVELLHEALLVEDIDSKIVVVNKSFCALTGYDEAEFINEGNIEMLIAEECREEFIAKREACKPEEPFEFETFALRKNQSRFRGLFKVTPLTDEQQQITGRIILLYDVTERREQRDAIKESDERLRFLLQSSSEGIAIHENGIILDANEAALKIFGCSHDEVVGKSLFLFTSPKEHEGLRELFRKKMLFQGEREMIDMQGMIRHVEVISKSVVFHGRDLRILTFKDITELREKKIEEQRLISIIEASPFLVAMMDASGIRYMNVHGKTMLGYGAGDDVSKLTVNDLMSKECAELILREAMPAASKNGVWDGQTTFRRKDGSEFHASQVIIAHRNQSGQVDFFSSLASDITDRIKAEQVLKDSQERLRYFMEESLEAIIIHEQGIIIDFNTAVSKMFGYDSDELSGKEILSLYDTSFQPEMKEKISKKQTVFDEWTGVRKDGSRFDIEVFSRPHTYHGKDVYVVSILDISRRKQTERALRSSQLLLNAAVEGTNVGIWEWNLITNQVTFNEAWRKLRGLKENTAPILFEDWKKTIYREDLPAVLEELRNHLYGLTPMYQHNYRIKMPSGEMLVFETRGKLVHDEKNLPVRIVGTIIDITERQQMEDALREREAQLSTLIENREESIWSVDREKRLIRFNTTFANNFKEFNNIELQQGMQITEYLPEKVALMWNEWYDKALDGESFQEVDRYDNNGQEIFVEYSLNPIKINEGKILGVSVLGRDITRQKYYEQSLEEAKNAAEEASRTKSQFLANISHEIRTPMNGIIGFTDLLLQSKVNRKQKEYLEIVHHSADSLLRLINDLLDISKIESGKLSLINREFEVRKLLHEIIRSFKAKANERSLKISALVDKSVPKILIGDEMRLQQIFVNLIGNAVKFSEHGKIVARIKREGKTGNVVRLIIEVEDEGIGISKEKYRTIFEPFTQLGDPFTSKYGGTGLGLSIARRLVEMMHGEMGVDSEPGKGSKFYFTVEMQVPE
ncbi:MAG TPA: PAS domain S-box protein [Chitinophagales bacterium]|nr:PAS domain S-box protein [Chitinophagales bacterium]